MINWKVRIANKTFWTLLIPAVLLVIQLALDIFGVTIDFGEIGNKLVALVDAVFAVLALMGIVTDPTTAGLHDSVRAMSYEEPWEDVPNRPSIDDELAELRKTENIDRAPDE